MNNSTPINGNANMPTSPASSMFSRESAAAAGTYAKDRVDELRQQASDGDFSVRLLGLLGGFAMILVSSLGLVGKVLTFQFVKGLLELYTLFLGVIIVILESRQIPFKQSFEATLQKYALFLKFVWGRGCLYFISGSLMLPAGHIIDLAVGCYVMIVGIIFMLSGRATARKLAVLKKSQYSEATLRAEFRQADTENKGAITVAQFKHLVHALGMDLSLRETEAAFLQLDKNDGGTLTVEEFLAWWRNDEQTNDGFAFV